ncbi:unnamed protein product [Caenorhabditis angaria]|uniref:Uncharacterized protein n=1 Tax=Caenorhabditis angaria TaxID=860376 RepID=A0A9P1N0C0_9PELO|nr:unnamed protein product [Caenorhabditis angaria]
MCIFLEIYSPFGVQLALIISASILFISILISLFAIYKLMTQSIIEYSTRIFLILSLLFVIYHQVSFLSLRVLTFVQIHLEICTNVISNCQFFMQGNLIGNAGLSFIQVSMSIDRILHLSFKNTYQKYRQFPGIFFVILTLFLSIYTYCYVIQDDELKEETKTCGELPTKSYGNYTNVLKFTFYLAIVDMFTDLIVLKLSMINEKKQRQLYSVTERFEAQAALKSTQTIMTISTIQFLSQILYTALFFILTYLIENFEGFTFLMINILGYPVPYTNTLHAVLIIHSLNRIKNQRLENIKSMTTQKQSSDEYMSKLKMHLVICNTVVSKCKLMIQGNLIGNSGLSLVQVAMSIERIIHIIFRKKYEKFKTIPGIIMTITTIYGAISVYSFIIGDNPFTDTVTTCTYLPMKTYPRYTQVLFFTFWLSISNLIVDGLILRQNQKHEKLQRNMYSVTKRFEATTSLKCTQAIMVISLVNVLSQILYSVLYFIIVFFIPDGTSFIFIFVNTLGYPVPYTSTLHACLIIYSLNRMRNQRRATIQSLTNQKQTFDDYIRNIKSAWA